VTELCSGQALGDADNDADTDAANKSNPYMSPFQGDTKMKLRVSPSVNITQQNVIRSYNFSKATLQNPRQDIFLQKMFKLSGHEGMILSRLGLTQTF
jgi:hypothetical protein